MSGDNAIVIGMATKNLPEKVRKKAIILGVVLATILRIIFAFFAVYLLSVPGLRFAGGLLLLYVVWEFYFDLRSTGIDNVEGGQIKRATLGTAIWTIILADVSMSLDNVLAVAGASNGNVVTLGIGLVFSIMLMAFASSFIAQKLIKYPLISWIGLLVILFVALEMIIKGIPDVSLLMGKINIYF